MELFLLPALCGNLSLAHELRGIPTDDAEAKGYGRFSAVRGLADDRLDCPPGSRNPVGGFCSCVGASGWVDGEWSDPWCHEGNCYARQEYAACQGTGPGFGGDLGDNTHCYDDLRDTSCPVWSYCYHDDCCGDKQTMHCLSGYRLQQSNDVCGELANAKAYSYRCLAPADMAGAMVVWPFILLAFLILPCAFYLYRTGGNSRGTLLYLESCPACGSLARQAKDDESLKSVLIPKLAAKACHLPGYTWSEDFVQYQFNSHRILGIFLHHPFSPVTRLERLFILLGDLFLGLLATSIVVKMVNQEAYNQARQDLQNMDNYDFDTLFETRDSFWDSETWDSFFNAASETLDTAVVAGMEYLLLLAFGVLQNIFIVVLWRLQACACFLPGGCVYSSERPGTNKACGRFGNIFAYTLVLAIICLVIFMMLLACPNSSDEPGAEELLNNEMECEILNGTFWKLWAYEVAVTAAISFGVETVIFSGVVSYLFCDKAVCLKFFGGRRAEVRAEKEEQEVAKEEEQEGARE